MGVWNSGVYLGVKIAPLQELRQLGTLLVNTFASAGGDRFLLTKTGVVYSLQVKIANRFVAQGWFPP